MNREYGHLLNEENFTDKDKDAFIDEALYVMNVTKAATKILDNNFQGLLK